MDQDLTMQNETHALISEQNSQSSVLRQDSLLFDSSADYEWIRVCIPISLFSNLTHIHAHHTQCSDIEERAARLRRQVK